MTWPSSLSCQVLRTAHTVALSVLALLKRTGAVQAPACSFPAMLPFFLQVSCAHCSSLEGPTPLEAVAPLEGAAWGAWAAGVQRTSLAACLEVSRSKWQSVESAVISHP